MTVGAFKWPQRANFVRSEDVDLKGSGAFVG